VYVTPVLYYIDEYFSKEGRKEGRRPGIIVVYVTPLSFTDGRMK
jgi:hypothetical protein